MKSDERPEDWLYLTCRNVISEKNRRKDAFVILGLKTDALSPKKKEF